MVKKMSVIMMSILMMMSFLLTSCDSRAKIKSMVTQTQKQLPMDLGMAGKITSFIYDEDNAEVVATIMVSSNLVEKGLGNLSSKEIRQNLLITLNLNKPFKDMLTMVAEADLTFKFVYVMGKGGKEVEVSLAPDDILSAENVDEKTAAEMYLKNEVKNSKRTLPMQIDEATTWTDIVIEPNCVVYIYELEESIISIELFKENKKFVKEELTKNVVENKDTAFVGFKKNCKLAGKGIKYKYIGSETNEAFEVTFKASEL